MKKSSCYSQDAAKRQTTGQRKSYSRKSGVIESVDFLTLFLNPEVKSGYQSQLSQSPNKKADKENSQKRASVSTPHMGAKRSSMCASPSLADIFAKKPSKIVLPEIENHNPPPCSLRRVDPEEIQKAPVIKNDQRIKKSVKPIVVQNNQVVNCEIKPKEKRQSALNSSVVLSKRFLSDSENTMLEIPKNTQPNSQIFPEKRYNQNTALFDVLKSLLTPPITEVILTQEASQDSTEASYCITLGSSQISKIRRI
jgi:hypothetical protein